MRTVIGKDVRTGVGLLAALFPAGGPVAYTFGIRNFYVAGPEGNLLEIGSTRKG